ncbi:MAG: hypothetical protein LH631_10390, partial [Alkalinema sp. CAN_BIN05]|nr:hypothetical protein [Alkalinema sp. CAN_BIN05]
KPACRKIRRQIAIGMTTALVCPVGSVSYSKLSIKCSYDIILCSIIMTIELSLEIAPIALPHTETLLKFVAEYGQYIT